MRPSCREGKVGQQAPCLAVSDVERFSRDDPGFKPAKERQLEASHGRAPYRFCPKRSHPTPADPISRFLYVPGRLNKKNNRRVCGLQALPSRLPTKIETDQTTDRTRDTGDAR